MLLDFAVGVILGAMAGMGVGGGGLLVIYLTMVLEMEQRMAQGVNLFFFIFASAASLIVHIANRNLRLSVIFICSVSGVAFAALGAHIAEKVHSDVLRGLFGVMLVACGAVNISRQILVKKKIKK